MATTMYFEDTVRDHKRKIEVELEFGRSSYYGFNTLYLVVDGKTVIVDIEMARKIVQAMADLGGYLGVDE